MPDSSNLRLVPALSGLVIMALGLAAGLGGAKLAALGGSWYYLIVGIGFVATGVLLLLRRRAALWLYALVVIGTVIWAVFEIGFDWWPLAARGDVIFPIGLYLLMPWITSSFRRDPTQVPPAAWRGAGLPLGLSLVIAAVVGVIALFSNEHDTFGTLSLSGTPPPDNHGGVPNNDWYAYGRTSHGTRYAPLTQITPDNVGKLQVAWHYRTGDGPRPGDPFESTFELTPLKVGDTVYLCTPHNWAVALDADKGTEKWTFDPKITAAPGLQHLTCRGVSYHSAAATGVSAPNGECPERIILPTADARLFALNAATGRPCPLFGNKGAVDLLRNMPYPVPGFYNPTSPPVVTRELIIIGGSVYDNASTMEPSGVIRAYDVVTGRLVWNFDPGNPSATEPIADGRSYVANSVNSWAVASADEQLGLVYLPMGNQPPDQYGGERTPENERFSSSILALEIATGKPRWVFQTTHHDLWDFDIPSQPSLVDLDTSNGTVPALIAPTKTGNLFVLDRRTGKPIIPVMEKPVPQGAVEGDRTATTQPFSALSLMPGHVKESDMWGATMFDQLLCRIAYRGLRYEGPYTPPSLQGSLVFPGNLGVFEWGGIAVDPINRIAFTRPEYLAFTSKLIRKSAQEYQAERAARRNPPMKALNELGGNPNFGAPYSVDMEGFLSPLGLPCQAPPWGYVAGIDLQTGRIAYRITDGTIRDSTPVPLPFKMGVPALGGPLLTAGGVAFFSGTMDQYIRAYDVATGKELWRDRLPAGGQSTPMSYRSTRTGRQFVIVAAGGHGSFGTRRGDHVIAYALPEDR